MSIQPGQRVDRYTVEALVGEGGMGRVFRAFDTRLERYVALKVLNPPSTGDAAEAVAIALREARAAAAIAHPNATAVYDAHQADGIAFIVMELVTGTSLRELITGPQGASGPILPPPLSTRLRWLIDIAGALAAAHRVGVIHRDVKPENVMVRDDGLVKVLDFGVARRAPVEVPAAVASGAGGAAPSTYPSGSRVAGTPAYMAPEQIRGEALDGRADQFGWAVLAYELLSGRLPWRSAKDFVGYVAAVITEDPLPLGVILPSLGVPPAADAAILRALSKTAAQRFSSMAAAAAELAPYARASLTMAAVEPRSPSSTVHARADRPAEPAPPRRDAASGDRVSDPAGFSALGRAPASPPSAQHAAISRPVPSEPSARGERGERVTDPGTDPGAFPSRIPLPSSARVALAPSSPHSRDSLLPEPPRASPRVPPPSPSSSTSARSFEVRRVPFREPRFDAPVDVAEHLALLPPDATVKGMFFTDVIQLVSRVMSAPELFRAALIPERRFTAFRDYPMADSMKLTVAAARALYPRSPLGEGLRRIGQCTFEAVLATHIGRALFGALGRDVEQVILTGPRAFKVLMSIGTVTSEKTGARAFALHIRGFPGFLETYQVGVLEGVLRHYQVRGQIRVALEDVANGTLELKLT